MKTIKVTINGQVVTTTPDKTILEVVQENQLDDIPTLCHDPRIEPFASCFVCVVEVEKVNRLLPSCATKVNEGMVIHTHSPRVIDSRKRALELLLSNHYADCIGPCKNNCPAGVDAQGYIALLARGKYTEALRLIKENNPLPLSIGRVCVRDCETACRRQIVDETVGINYLKRFLADTDGRDMWKPEIPKVKKQKVAVIGGGPSGLTCAYYLTCQGYAVTIFDQLPELGGMLKYGIPEYRLPKEILDQEIGWITGLGVEVKTKVSLGKDFQIADLFKQKFAAVYVAIGAHKATSLRLPGEDEIEGVLRGIDFLRQVQMKALPRLKGTVVVVGGGNTAIDAARTAFRYGADQVKLVYRRSVKEMPAHHSEVEAAQHEGVEYHFLTNPKSIVRDGNRLKGIECLQMELKEVPGERPRPVPKAGSEFVIECDYLIGAIGQEVDSAFNKTTDPLPMEKWGTIKADPGTLTTSIPGVFAGGDVVTGPWTAIGSIAHGKKAAEAIDQYLTQGQVQSPGYRFLSFKHTLGDVKARELDFAAPIKKEVMPELPAEIRRHNFEEVELGFSQSQCQNETGRCLECGCSEYYDCRLRKYCDQYQIDIQPFKGEYRVHALDFRHPYITLDANKCINCGICVRTCSEVLEISALGFVNRGFPTVVKPALEKPLHQTTCISCGNCVDACPTGALSEKFPFKIMGALPKTDHASICNYCSIGCPVNFKVIDEGLFYISNTTSAIRSNHTQGYTCFKGRFGYRYLLEPGRLTRPQIRENNQLVETDWEKALQTIVDRLQSIRKKYGPESVAVFASPKLSNQELYLLQKLTRTGLAVNNIGSFSHFSPALEPDALDEALGMTASTASLEDLAQADVVMVINTSTSDSHLILEQKLKAARRKGTKLIIVNSAETMLTKSADLWVDTRKGTNTVLLNGLIRELMPNQSGSELEGYDSLAAQVKSFSPEKVSQLSGISLTKFQELLNQIKNPETKLVVVYQVDFVREKSPNDLRAIANLLLLTGRMNKPGNGLLLMREYANSEGLYQMGVSPHYLPGYVKYSESSEIQRISRAWNWKHPEVFKPVDLPEKMRKGEIKAVLVFGEDPLLDAENRKYFRDVEFLVVSDLYLTATAAQAQVVLPASSHLESAGAYISSDLRVQSAPWILPPRSGRENWQIISDLGQRLIPGFSYQSLSEVDREISQIHRFYPEPSGLTSTLQKPVRENYLTVTGKARFLIHPVEVTDVIPQTLAVLNSEDYFRNRLKARLLIQ